MKTAIALLALAGIMKSGDARINGWTMPADGNADQEVPEDQQLSVTITKIAATVDDGITVTYTLLTPGTPFDVASNGDLTITTALDYETIDTYTLLIQAVDSDTPSGTGTATLTIGVTDANDAPTFSSSTFSACVNDGLTEGMSVYTVTASDQDSRDAVTYSITDGDSNGDFKVSGSDIQVNVGKTLDKKTTANYVLFVQADDSTAQTTATVSVTVGDCSSAPTVVVSVLTILLSLAAISC